MSFIIGFTVGAALMYFGKKYIDSVIFPVP